jgi:hypothetical protein
MFHSSHLLLIAVQARQSNTSIKYPFLHCICKEKKRHREVKKVALKKKKVGRGGRRERERREGREETMEGGRKKKGREGGREGGRETGREDGKPSM